MPHRPPRYLVALLRAVNVGGTGTLAMRDLSAICGDLGFTDVRTYIQSGNVVFRTPLDAAKVRRALERALMAKVGLGIDVIVREAAELAAILAGNPYRDAPPNRVHVLFSSGPLPEAAFNALKGPAGETAVARTCEAYLHYPNGMGQSRLKLPKLGSPVTARNMTTVAALVRMCAEPIARD
jgi:uncharacterized protein (DUF1697 family)